MVHVGTSGWQYQHWRGSFYPVELPQGRWLEFYAEHFQVVEINNAFYRLPEAAAFATWRARTPPDFAFAVKASRFLTHIRRLRDPEEPVQRLMDRAGGLAEKLGPVLLQLPPQLEADPARLEQTLRAFGGRARVAVEFRHPSWFEPPIRSLLERHGAALCLTDRRGPITPEWATTDWGYVRLHQGGGFPSPAYRRSELEEWVERLDRIFGAQAPVYVFFNNDGGGAAVRDAVAMAELAQQAGLRSSRVAAVRSDGR